MSLSCQYGCRLHRHDAQPLTCKHQSFLSFYTECSLRTSNSIFCTFSLYHSLPPNFIQFMQNFLNWKTGIVNLIANAFNKCAMSAQYLVWVVRHVSVATCAQGMSHCSGNTIQNANAMSFTCHPHSFQMTQCESSKYILFQRFRFEHVQNAFRGFRIFLNIEQNCRSSSGQQPEPEP